MIGGPRAKRVEERRTRRGAETGQATRGDEETHTERGGENRGASGTETPAFGGCKVSDLGRNPEERVGGER